MRSAVYGESGICRCRCSGACFGNWSQQRDLYRCQFRSAPAVALSRFREARAVAPPVQERGGRSGFCNQISLLVGEFALALMLLIGSVLLVESLLRLQRVEPGIDPQNVLTMKRSLGGSGYTTTAAVSSLFHRAIERIEELPGVNAAGARPPKTRGRQRIPGLLPRKSPLPTRQCAACPASSARFSSSHPPSHPLSSCPPG